LPPKAEIFALYAPSVAPLGNFEVVIANGEIDGVAFVADVVYRAQPTV
jgi:hypothetical protein